MIRVLFFALSLCLVTFTSRAVINVNDHRVEKEVLTPCANGKRWTKCPGVTTYSKVTLSWNIPTKREDNTDLALSEIGHYIISYGTDSANLDQKIKIRNPNQVSLDITKLQSGATYYFAIATVDTEGTQGGNSEIISITIPAV